MKELGYGPENPLKLELRYDSSENNTNTGIAIQEQLRPLGIAVSLFNTDAKTHYGYLDGGGDFDFARSGWIADYKDPETFLGIARRASGMNNGHFDSPEFERLMDAGMAAGANPDERMKLLAQAEKLLIDEQGVVPLLFLQLTQHRVIAGERLGGQCDEHPSVPLRQLSNASSVNRQAGNPAKAQPVAQAGHVVRLPEV